MPPIYYSLKKGKFFFRNTIFLLLTSICFQSCIGEDVIDDFVEPEVRILNPTAQIEISKQHTFEAKYFNNIGVEEDIQIVWKSSDENIVSINGNGIATALAGGTVTITATVTSNSGTTIVEETVMVPHVDPEVRILNPVTAIEIGQQHTYEAIYFNNNGKEEEAEILWESSDEAIISVDENGTATAHAGGTTTITASVTLNSGVVTKEETVEVSNVEPKVRILNPIAQIQIGNQHTYQAKFFNNNGMEEDVEILWESSDENIISIDENGTATALTGGTAIITAFVELNSGTVTGEESVEVLNLEPQVRILNPIEEIKVDNTHSYQAQYLNTNGIEEDILIRWESSDENIISIDMKGLATALSEGTATISAYIETSGTIIRAEDTVVVTQDFVEPEVRILNPIEEIEIGDTYSYEALYFNNLGVPQEVTIIWESSNENIISINANGVATALAEGTATITASFGTNNGNIRSENTVTVTPNFVDPIINIVNPITEIEINNTHNYQAVYFNNLGEQENIQIQWESSNGNIISVNANGVATALSEGTATISASAQTSNGIIRDENTITVTPNFVDPIVNIVNPVAEIEVNDTYTYQAVYFNNLGEQENIQIQWESSNENVVTINANGMATAIAEGTATISASAQTSNGVVRDDVNVNIIQKEIISKQGTIVTTSSYLLEGNFTITENNSGGIVLNISEDYEADTRLPGLYLYLTNNPNSVNGALEVGVVEVFSGQHSYTIPNVGINDFSYLLYWCKPFTVKVGEGEIEE